MSQKQIISNNSKKKAWENKSIKNKNLDNLVIQIMASHIQGIKMQKCRDIRVIHKSILNLKLDHKNFKVILTINIKKIHHIINHQFNHQVMKNPIILNQDMKVKITSQGLNVQDRRHHHKNIDKERIMIDK